MDNFMGAFLKCTNIKKIFAMYQLHIRFILIIIHFLNVDI